MDLCGLLYTQPPSLLKMLFFPSMYLCFTYKKSGVHRRVDLCVCVQFNPLTNMSVLSKYLSVIITTLCGTFEVLFLFIIVLANFVFLCFTPCKLSFICL